MPPGKAAIVALADRWRSTTGPQGIRLRNTLQPGLDPDPDERGGDPEDRERQRRHAEEAFAHATRYLPLGRMAEPIEIARCARFLASAVRVRHRHHARTANGSSSADVDVGYISLL